MMHEAPNLYFVARRGPPFVVPHGSGIRRDCGADAIWSRLKPLLLRAFQPLPVLQPLPETATLFAARPGTAP
jgi:hypothetical protein